MYLVASVSYTHLDVYKRQEWYKLNTQQYVYCRVNYALQDWQILARLLQDHMTVSNL